MVKLLSYDDFQPTQNMVKLVFPTYKTWWLVGLPGYIFIVYNSGNSPKTVNLWYLRLITSRIVNSWRWWWCTPKNRGFFTPPNLADQNFPRKTLCKTQTKSLFHWSKNVVDFHLSFFCQNDFQQKKQENCKKRVTQKFVGDLNPLTKQKITWRESDSLKLRFLFWGAMVLWSHCRIN